MTTASAINTQITSTYLGYDADGKRTLNVEGLRGWLRTQMAAAITWRVHGSGDYGIYDFAEIGGTKPPADATRNVKRGAWSGSGCWPGSRD